jgi:hypothetical protein
MENRKTVPLSFLVEKGLLFEINRSILHPLGLALAFADDGAGGESMLLLDERDDPEGFIFLEDTLNHGYSKLEAFMNEYGYAKLASRKERLGFIVQELELNLPEEVVSVDELQEILDEPVIPIVINKDGSLPTIPKAIPAKDEPAVTKGVMSVRERNDEIKKKRGSKLGSQLAGEGIRPPEKNVFGNCLHVNVTKEPLGEGGYLKFCADCGIPIEDSDLK